MRRYRITYKRDMGQYGIDDRDYGCVNAENPDAAKMHVAELRYPNNPEGVLVYFSATEEQEEISDYDMLLIRIKMLLDDYVIIKKK